MMRRAVVGVGRALRETGQAIERMGCRAQDNWIFQEKFSRHRALMNLFDQRPALAPNTFIAPSASVVGNVELKPHTSVWCAALPNFEPGDEQRSGEGSGAPAAPPAPLRPTRSADAPQVRRHCTGRPEQCLYWRHVEVGVAPTPALAPLPGLPKTQLL